MPRNASSPLWVRIFAIALVVPILLALWQYIASFALLALLYKGKPPFQVMPWTWFEYVLAYHSNKKVLGPAVITQMLSAAVCIGFPIFLAWPKGRKLHGEARFARASEIRASGLLRGDGILIGKLGKQYLRCPDQQHVMLAAPTGSGKGIGIVLPNLLTWNHSAVVLDVKRENWGYTAGYRARHGHKVFLFDPASPTRNTHRWNPFSTVSADPVQRVDDIQKIAQIWFPDIEGVDPLWASGSRSLFLAIALYLIETGSKLTLGNVARETFSLDHKRLQTLIADKKAAGIPFSRACELSLTDFINTPDKTRDSIRKTFTSRLEMFINPNVDAATSESDFDLSMMRKQRMTVYLGTSPSNLDRLAPLFNLFFQTVVSLHTVELPEQNKDLKYRLLLLIDEFAALGKMQVLVNSIAFIRGYNIVLMPIFQSPTQVRGIYGDNHAETFFDNHACRIIYRPDSFPVAEALSKELGTDTVKNRSKSKPSMGAKGGSTSESEAARSLLLPQELQQLDPWKEIIFSRGLRPFECQKMAYYEDDVFLNALREVSPSLAALGGRKPTRKQLEHALISGELAPPVPVTPLPEYEAIAGPTDERELRPVEVADLDKLHSIPLSDFSLDFSNIEIPTGDMDEDQIAEMADKVYRQICT